MAQKLDQALAAIAQGSARVLAGGTDYFPSRTRGGPLPTLVDVSRVPEMLGINKTENGWRIGGATTWSQLIAADLPSAFNGLKSAAREVGSVQIQNTGTLAGNLCNASPAADGVPALLSLGASVALSSSAGTRLLPLQDFLTGVRQTSLRKGELMSAVHVPDLNDHAKGYFAKLGSRRYLVISITMVGAVLGLDRSGRVDFAQFAIGACSPVARRQPDLETKLIGQRPADVRITPDDLHGLSPIEDVRGDAHYRMIAAAEQCNRILREVMPR